MARIINWVCIGLIGLLLSVCPLAEPLNSDRPDVGTSATTVGEGVFQLESGFALTKEDGRRSVSFPTLLRLGVSDRLEFRIESDILTLRRHATSGFADVLIGAKANLYDSESSQLGLLLELNIPAGPKNLRGSLDPRITFLWDQDLGREWSFEGNLGFALSRSELGNRFGEFSFSGSFSRPIADSVDLYVELSGTGPDKVTGNYFTALDTGAAFRATDDMQFDVYYLKGLSSFGIDWQIGSGMSIRF